MTSESLEKTLKESIGDIFFASLKNYVGFEVPLKLQLILSLNAYKTAYAISQLNDNDIEEMESFVRIEFHEQMVTGPNKTADYLGVYEHRQDKFKFLSGEKKFLCQIAESCRKIYGIQQKQSSQLSLPDKNMMIAQSQCIALPITNPLSIDENSVPITATTKGSSLHCIK